MSIDERLWDQSPIPIAYEYRSLRERLSNPGMGVNLGQFICLNNIGSRRVFIIGVLLKNMGGHRRPAATKSPGMKELALRGRSFCHLSGPEI